MASGWNSGLRAQKSFRLAGLKPTCIHTYMSTNIKPSLNITSQQETLFSFFDGQPLAISNSVLTLPACLGSPKRNFLPAKELVDMLLELFQLVVKNKPPPPGFSSLSIRQTTPKQLAPEAKYTTAPKNVHPTFLQGMDSILIWPTPTTFRRLPCSRVEKSVLRPLDWKHLAKALPHRSQRWGPRLFAPCAPAARAPSPTPWIPLRGWPYCS